MVTLALPDAASIAEAFGQGRLEIVLIVAVLVLRFVKSLAHGSSRPSPARISAALDIVALPLGLLLLGWALDQAARWI